MKKSCLILTFLLVLLAFPIFAQTISLSEALAFVLLSNPELASFSFDMRADDARILQAGVYPNPALDIETENLGVEEVQTTFLLSQLIELGGKRQARQLHAYAERTRNQLDYEVKKRQLFIETTELFIEVLVNQQKLAFLETTLPMLEGLTGNLEKRIEAGKASAVEQNNFKALIARTRIDFLKTQNDLRQSKNKLAAKWGATTNVAFEVSGSLDWTLPVVSLEELGGFLYTHPEIQLLSGEEGLREARLAVEKSKSMPDITVRGGPRYLFDRDEWVWVLGVYIPLPINDKNCGNILAAYENWRKIEAERQAVWTKLLSLLNQAYSIINNLAVELNVLIRDVLPATKNALSISYKGYQGARYNYLDVLESERSFRSAQLRYFEALEQYHKALAQLEGLTGSQAIFRCAE